MFLIFIILAAISKSVSDTLVHHYDRSIFKEFNPLFWDPRISWRNKYKEGEPRKGEKFPGSTTLLVALTGGWHLSQSIMLTSLFIGLVIYSPTLHPLLDFIVCRITFGIFFEIFYKYILR